MPAIKEIWKDPVWSKVIAAAILAACAALVATLQGWWPAIRGVVAIAWNWLGESSRHPNWLLIALWLALALLLISIIFIVIASFNSEPRSQKHSWKSYTTDHFFGLQWTWKLDDSGLIYDVFALCADCKCQVYSRRVGHYREDKYGFYCDVCENDKAIFNSAPDFIEQKVKLRIAKNLRTGEWASARI